VAGRRFSGFYVCLFINFWIPFIICGGLLLLGVLVTQFTCAFCDPGIIPRVLTPVDVPESVNRDINEVGTIRQETYCRTFHIWRPPRSHHCSNCDNCILQFDHHCPWMGNCIGVRNYRIFFAFLCLTSITTLYVASVSVYKISLSFPSQWSMSEVFSTEPYAVSLVIYCVLILFCVGGLSLYHCFLISTAKSTYENVKELDSTRWDRGCIGNFRRVLCGPLPDSLLDLQAPVVVGAFN